MLCTLAHLCCVTSAVSLLLCHIMLCTLAHLCCVTSAVSHHAVHPGTPRRVLGCSLCVLRWCLAALCVCAQMVLGCSLCVCSDGAWLLSVFARQPWPLPPPCSKPTSLQHASWPDRNMRALLHKRLRWSPCVHAGPCAHIQPGRHLVCTMGLHKCKDAHRHMKPKARRRSRHGTSPGPRNTGHWLSPRWCACARRRSSICFVCRPRPSSSTHSTQRPASPRKTW